MRTSIVTVLLVLLTGFAVGQPKKIIACAAPPGQLTEEIFGKPFADSQVSLRALLVADTDKDNKPEVWVQYEKTAKPAPNHQPDPNAETAIGLALYEWYGHSNGYRLLFANDQAFFCGGCNNAKSQDLAFENDLIQISISWGPSTGGAYTAYEFKYDKHLKNWILTEMRGSSSENNGRWAKEGERISLYENRCFANQFRKPVSIRTYNAEEVEYDTANMINGITYTYDNSKPLATVLANFKLIKSRNKAAVFGKVFDQSDAETIVEDYPVTIKNLATMNDIGYELEQMNVLDAAKYVLEKILEKYPNRMVAYLNLGDVYRKQNQVAQAKKCYETYIGMMKQKKLEKQIPPYLFTYPNK